MFFFVYELFIEALKHETVGVFPYLSNSVRNLDCLLKFIFTRNRYSLASFYYCTFPAALSLVSRDAGNMTGQMGRHQVMPSQTSTFPDNFWMRKQGTGAVRMGEGF